MLPSVSFGMYSAYYSTESLQSSDILGPRVYFHFKVDHHHLLVTNTIYDGSEIVLGESCSVGPQQVFDNIEFPYLFLPLTMQYKIHDMLTSLQIPPSDIEGLKQGIASFTHQMALNCRERRSRFMGIVIELIVQFKEQYYVQPRIVEEELEELEADILTDVDEDGSFYSFVPQASSLASIQALEVTKFGDAEDDQSPSSSIESCAICIDEFVTGVDVARLPCSHIFHEECILKWLENKNSCPLCRFVLPTQD